MEVAVITRHAIANYGSLLQAAATQNAIEALGHSCRIIDYVRPNEVCTQLHKCQLQQKPRWNRTPLRPPGVQHLALYGECDGRSVV